VFRVRGKNKIWALSLLFIASLMLSVANVRAIPPDYTVSLDQAEYGPVNPGGSFEVKVEAGYLESVRAVELELKWDPTVLRMAAFYPEDPPSLGAMLEGPFLGQYGGETDPVARKGLAGDRLNFNNLIKTFDWVDGDGVIASITFEVIGGGETDLDLSGRILDPYFDPVGYDVTWVGGYFWNPVPHIAFTWWVPTGVPETTATTNGTSYYVVTDPDGDTDYVDGPPYLAERPVLTLDDATGAPESSKMVEGGTMFAGDEIIFNATASYDLDAPHHRVPLDPTKFKWIIRAGGMDSYKRGGVTADFRYESGDELPFGPIFSYWFPGPLAKMAYTYTWYGASHLGFHDVQIEVEDAQHNKAKFYTWIRIYRLSVAKVVMSNVPNQHSLSKDDYTMRLGAKMQNRGGTNWFIWDSLSVYLELARMIHAYVWGRMQFDIKTLAGVPVARVYTDAIFIGPTETPVNVMWATWNMNPDTISKGYYTVTATGWFCGSGISYKLKATGSATQLFEIID